MIDPPGAKGPVPRNAGFGDRSLLITSTDNPDNSNLCGGCESRRHTPEHMSRADEHLSTKAGTPQPGVKYAGTPQLYTSRCLSRRSGGISTSSVNFPPTDRLVDGSRGARIGTACDADCTVGASRRLFHHFRRVNSHSAHADYLGGTSLSQAVLVIGACDASMNLTL